MSDLLKILIRYLINLLKSSWIQFICYVSTLFKIQSQSSLKPQMLEWKSCVNAHLDNLYIPLHTKQTKNNGRYQSLQYNEGQTISREFHSLCTMLHKFKNTCLNSLKCSHAILISLMTHDVDV